MKAGREKEREREREKECVFVRKSEFGEGKRERELGKD